MSYDIAVKAVISIAKGVVVKRIPGLDPEEVQLIEKLSEETRITSLR